MASEPVKTEGKVKGGLLIEVAEEVFSSPLNLALVALIAYLVYKIYKSHAQPAVEFHEEPELPPMKKRDFTIEELKQFDGTGKDGRLLVAVNGKVFDVTKGKRFYGAGGPYAAFAGRDASRGLATFSVTGTEGYDDLSDLDSMQMDSVREWDNQFTEKYEYVGKLLKPGQAPSTYSDDEEDTSQEVGGQQPEPVGEPVPDATLPSTDNKSKSD